MSESEFLELFKDHDFIAPRPSHYKSVKEHYEKSHNSNDLVKLLEVIDKVAPEYSDDAKEYLDSKDEYLYNMFVFRKEDFLHYCNFLFKVVNEFAKDNDENLRLYISERLTGIYIWNLIKSGKRPLYLPILHVRSKSLKAARKQVKQNMKDKVDNGLMYRLKPLILCFLPRHVEQWFRRRKAK